MDVAVSVGVTVAVGVAVAVAVQVGVAVELDVGEEVTLGVTVLVLVAVGVEVDVGVLDGGWVCVGVTVAVIVGVRVGIGVLVVVLVADGGTVMVTVGAGVKAEPEKKLLYRSRLRAGASFEFGSELVQNVSVLTMTRPSPCRYSTQLGPSLLASTVFAPAGRLVKVPRSVCCQLSKLLVPSNSPP